MPDDTRLITRQRDVAKQHPKIEETVALIRAWRDLDLASKAAGSASEKAKTVARNSLKQFMADHGLPHNTELVVDDLCVRYAAAIHEAVPPEAWLNAYETNDITRETFLAAIKVSKEVVKERAGADIAKTLSVETPGKELDLRTSKVEQPTPGIKLLVPDEAPTLQNAEIIGGARKVRMRLPIHRGR